MKTSEPYTDYAGGGLDLSRLLKWGLVALIVMSIGMLGIAGLYVQSLQAGRTSMNYHHAVNLASDAGDRIRSNPAAGAAYAGDGRDMGCVATGRSCSPAEMAAHDVFQWGQQAENALPGGRIDVGYDASTFPPVFQIRVSWDDGGSRLEYATNIPVIGKWE